MLATLDHIPYPDYPAVLNQWVIDHRNSSEQELVQELEDILSSVQELHLTPEQVSHIISQLKMLFLRTINYPFANQQ